MASTEEQDLSSQSSLSRLLSENETHSTNTMDLPKKEAPRFETLPPEVRNIIYRHLFPPARFCKGSRLESKWFCELPHRATHRHYVYIYPTAIFRSNHLVGQEARSVLYGSNTFVLFNLTCGHCACHMFSTIMKDVAWNPVCKSAPVPSSVVRINHRRQNSKPKGPSIIVAAADVNLICKKAVDWKFCCYGPTAAYFLVAMPELGWQHERLLTMIWLPLKALRECRRNELEKDGSYYSVNAGVTVTDCTGVFEEADEMHEPKDSESGSVTESSRDNHTEKHESDGSSSERSENGDHDSNAEEEEEEDDSEEADCTSNGSDDVAHEKSGGDETSTSRKGDKGDLDEAPSNKGHELCSNVSD